MKFDLREIMMVVIIILVAMFLLVMGGCEKVTGPPLETECKYDTPISLMVIEYDTQPQINAAWEFYTRDKLPKASNIGGFATYNRAVQIHTLHVLKIRGQKDSHRIETLGHELMHSFCGDWHPRHPRILG